MSIVLKNLGVESTVLGFIAGFTGEKIRKELSALGCKDAFIEIEHGWSRINMKVRSDEESEINGQGPVIDAQAMKELYAQLDKLEEDDILVLAGSIPNTMPSTVYSDIMEYLEGRKVNIVVDATKDLLVNVLKYHPFLIKPNNHELEEIFGTQLKSNEEIIQYAKELQKIGARNVLVSMAAILVAEDGNVYESEAPKGEVVNSVGAGDSMVAGFVAGYLATEDYKQAFKMGIAAGSASAFSEELAKKEEVEAILNTLIF